MPKLKGILGLLALVCASCCAQAVAAQAYPSKPIRLIVPWPPGGGTDVIARAVAQKLRETANWSVVVENIPGAGGNIGTDVAAKALPDGYTIILATSSLAYNPSLFTKLSYNPIRDFAPITLAASIPHVLVVSPSSPVTTVKELVLFARANPGKLNYASAGVGSNFQLAAELFKKMAGVNIVHVAYQGGGPAVLAVLNGEMDLTFANLVAVRPLIQASKLKAIGVTSTKRLTAVPDVPTIAESGAEVGLKDYEFATWFGFLAPAKVPKAIVAKLNEEIVRVLKTPDIVQRLSGQGADLVASTPDEFASYLAADTEKWSNIIKDAGIRVSN